MVYGLGNFFQNRFLAKALATRDFRYLSNSAAFSLDRKAIAVSIRHDRNLDVWDT